MQIALVVQNLHQNQIDLAERNQHQMVLVLDKMASIALDKKALASMDSIDLDRKDKVMSLHSEVVAYPSPTTEKYFIYSMNSTAPAQYTSKNTIIKHIE